MTREEIASALDHAPHGIALAPFARAVRALPVIATCGECGWHRDYLGGRDCAHKDGRGVIGAVSWDPPPPSWCPLRGKR